MGGRAAGQVEGGGTAKNISFRGSVSNSARPTLQTLAVDFLRKSERKGSSENLIGKRPHY